MRLVDADKFKEWICENLGESYAEEIAKLMDEQPTAYNLDKTIIELGKEFKLAEMDKEIVMIENPLQFDYVRGYAMGISNALEIVKGGFK